MKNIILIAFVGMLLITSCEEPVVGNGAIKTENRDCKNFNSIITDLTGAINVYCTPDTAFSCNISAQENILQHIECSIEKEELLVRFKRTSKIKSHEPITINITMPNIVSYKILGQSNATLIGDIRNKETLLAIMGNGGINASGLHTDKLRVDITGNAKANILNSACKSAEYAIKGNGTLEAKTNTVDSVRAICTGNGEISCYAAKAIDAEINGNGSINYQGTPVIYRSKIGGNGKINGDGVLPAVR
jgi:hypothetical protein